MLKVSNWKAKGNRIMPSIGCSSVLIAIMSAASPKNASRYQDQNQGEPTRQ